jgi:hypothetical protein
MDTRSHRTRIGVALFGNGRRASRTRPPALALLLLALGLEFGLPVLAPGVAAPARAAERQDLAYTVYFGPLPALDVTTAIEAGATGVQPPGTRSSPYRVEASVVPEAWIAWALPWQAHSEATGRTGADGTIHPENYLASAQWGVRTRKTTLTYTGGALHITLDPPGDNEGREPVPPELTTGSLDPVSAVLALLTTAADGHGCSPSLPVFDGRRRFDLAAETLTDEMMPASRYGVYAGPVTVCRLHFRSLAGGWRDGERARFWQTDQPGTERPPIDLWLARLHPEAPPVPVYVTGGSTLGWVTVYLSSYSFAPSPPPGP